MARKALKLEYFSMGNGLSVADVNSEIHGDYAKVAHIQGKPNQDVVDGDDIVITVYLNYIAKIKRSYPVILLELKKEMSKSFPNSKYFFEESLSRP